MMGDSGAQSMTIHVIAVIATALAVAAALELAYTLFTPGPDEAIDPLMLRRKFIDGVDVRQNQSARRAALEPGVRKFMGEDNA